VWLKVMSTYLNLPRLSESGKLVKVESETNDDMNTLPGNI